MNVYTNIDDASLEIKNRWNNDGLKKKVLEYFDGDLPKTFCEPRAVLSRNIATPDIECVHFFNLAKKIGLLPIICEGVGDKFSSASSDKVGLVKLNFFDGYDKNHQLLRHHKKIIDIPSNDGKKFNVINTLWGENLVDFHHRILKEYLHESVDLFDDFDWFHKIGMKTTIGEYYKNFFVFFVCHGVLFENFVTDAEELEFFDKIVQPAFEYIESYFGVKPLIVELAPHDQANNPYWWCYPSDVEKYILKVDM